MFIDRDSWGRFSINDLSERDIRLLHEGLKAYVRENLGRIPPADGARLLRFDSEYLQAVLPTAGREKTKAVANGRGKQNNVFI